MSCANRGITYEFAALFWSASSFTVVKVLFLTCRKLGVGQPVLHDRTPRSGGHGPLAEHNYFPRYRYRRGTAHGKQRPLASSWNSNVPDL